MVNRARQFGQWLGKNSSKLETGFSNRVDTYKSAEKISMNIDDIKSGVKEILKNPDQIVGKVINKSIEAPFAITNLITKTIPYSFALIAGGKVKPTNKSAGDFIKYKDYTGERPNQALDGFLDIFKGAIYSSENNTGVLSLALKSLKTITSPYKTLKEGNLSQAAFSLHDGVSKSTWMVANGLKNLTTGVTLSSLNALVDPFERVYNGFKFKNLKEAGLGVAGGLAIGTAVSSGWVLTH